jgi:hypothetical protein
MRRLPFVLVLALPLLASCGANLLVVRRPGELRLPGGGSVPITVAYREPDGFLQSDDPPLHAPLIGLLVEPIDWLQSTVIAAGAVVRSDWSVAGGPFGWLAALTPFATLVPQLHLPPAFTADADDAAVTSLRAGDDGPARDALGDARIVRVWLRDQP